MPAELIYKGRYEPFDHQRQTVEFLLARDKAFVFNDIGTGKTLCTLWALDNLRARPERANGKTLIITPKSTVDFVWGREIFKTLIGTSYASLLGSRAKRHKLLDEDPDIVIVNPNYQALDAVITHPWSNDIDVVVVDESTAFKNHKTKAYKNLQALLHADPTLWMLSGSPMPQEPTDIWAQAKLVCPDKVHKTFGRFRDWAMIRVSDFIWKPRPNIEAKIAELLEEHSIRFTRDECIDIPPVDVQHKDVEPSRELLDVISKLKAEATIELQNGHLTAVNSGVYLSKILQAASGAVKYERFDDTQAASGVVWVNCKSKLEALAETLDASDRPVIVYASYKAPLTLLEAWLKKQDIAYRRVDGDTPQRERDSAFDALNEHRIKVLIAHPKCISHGLDLIGSNVIVWWGLPASLETFIQANGRITRQGQKFKQLILCLLATAEERRTYSRLKDRESMQGLLLEIIANN